MVSMTILTPEECTAVLLDGKRSPVVSLDTEFDISGGTPTCRAPLNGVSMAGGTPEHGFFGAFWPFGGGREIAPWGWLRDRIIIPVLSDPARTIVMHPLKTDMQILRARGVREEHCRARAECTMSLVHVYDENLPKGLKDLASCLLGVHDVASYAETQRELKKLIKEGERTAKDIIKSVWETYRDERKKSKEAEARIDPAWPSWKRLAMMLPAGLTKGAVEERVEGRIRSVVISDYERRAQARFAKYGAEDALFTIAIRYWLRAALAGSAPARIAVESGLVDNETEICHPITTELEEAGLKIDIPRLRSMHDAIAAAIAELRADVIERWGIDVGDGGPTAASSIEDPPEDGAEEVFNPASTDQVCRIVWDVWRLRPPPWTMQGGELRQKFRRAKDGYCKVDKDVLGWLADNAAEPYRTHIARLLELRRHEKMMSSFVIPLLAAAMADPEGRVHATFWPVGARTGRFTANDPAVETIPRPNTMPKIRIPAGADPEKPPPGVVREKERDKVTKQDKVVWRVDSLRKVFISETGWKLVSADLSQIENRLTAHESQDPGLLALYRVWDCADCKSSGETTEPLHACPKCGAKDGKRDKTHRDQPAIKGFCLGRDIHADTSARTGALEKYGYEEGRQRSKATNHAATYGMSPRTYAQRDGISVKEAEELLERWHEARPMVRVLHNRVRQEIQDRGYVVMFDGSIRRFPVQRLLLRSNNFAPWEWEGTIREGVNVLMQGGTGRIMKLAMPRIRRRLREHPDPRVRRTKLVNQVHDEVLYEAIAEVADEVLRIACFELENVVQLSVPIIAEGKTGISWGAAH